VFVVRGTSPENVIFICLAIGAAALVGLGALRMLSPLVTTEPFEAEMVGNRTRAALEREKNLVLRAIKELEFDHAMGKISSGDYDDMVARLRSRAARLLKQLDSTGTGYREIIERELASRFAKLGAAPLAYADVAESVKRDERREQREVGTCASCGTINDEDAKFCKSCGTKLMAMLIAIVAVLSFAFAAPAFAQFQMPDPKEMSGIPRPVTDLPEQHVSVRLIRGQLSNNIPDFPVEMQSGGKVVGTVKTDENGRAEFSGIAPGTNVKAVAVVDGERLESQEFPWPAQGGIRLMLVATDKSAAGRSGGGPPAIAGDVVLGDQTRVIIELADEALQVYYLLDIQNKASSPVNPTKAFLLDMPSGAQGTTVMGGAPRAVARGDRVTVTGPFPPGTTSVQVGYALPYKSGEVTFSQPLPVPVAGIAVLMKKVGGMTLSSPQLPKVQERPFEGDTYILAQGSDIRAGGNLAITVDGLPHHSPVPRWIALSLVVLIGGIACWAAVNIPKQPGSGGRVKQLTNKREKIYADLMKLEQQRRAGTIDAARHGERRQTLIAQLERVYRDLDAESGQGVAA
jgi:hypothetical protein